MIMNYWTIVLVLALAGIIIYFLLRIRSMMRAMPGADSKMNTVELVKNWQEQKALEAQYQNDLKARAREAAKPEVERIMMQRLVDAEIGRATTNKGTFSEKLKTGLGIDLDKAGSKENLAFMTGNSGGGIFGRDKIRELSKNTVKDVEGTADSVDTGVKNALKRDSRMSGLNEALYGKHK